MKEYFDYLLKRRSMRRYDETLKLSNAELSAIKDKLQTLVPLADGIAVDYKLLPREDTNCKWNAEYCLLVYSEEKENYLQNVGYMLEQLDLFMASIDVGVCWYGWGSTKEKRIGDKRFVIMLCFGKCAKEDFRRDLTAVKRKPLSVSWQGDLALDAAEIARYSPSACNSQPWHVICNNNQIALYQTTEIKSIVAKRLSAYYNKIDVGIYMCILESSMEQFSYNFTRTLLVGDKENKLIPVATYTLTSKINN